VEHGSTVAIAGDSPPVSRSDSAPTETPRSRIDRVAEDAAREFLGSGKRDEALKVLMTAYGAPIAAFVARVLRDRELAHDVYQQTFLDAFQGMDGFQGRGTLWSWLCGIAYHRCLDELRRVRRTEARDVFAVFEELVEQADPATGPDQVATRQALEQCLGQLSPPMRSQLLMRCFLGFSYGEIAEMVGATHSTVQVRVSRMLPRLRRCLLGKGITR
jgi:RNA polymerase sigma-70 factor (ECF subfamily)